MKKIIFAFLAVLILTACGQEQAQMPIMGAQPGYGGQTQWNTPNGGGGAQWQGQYPQQYPQAYPQAYPQQYPQQYPQYPQGYAQGYSGGGVQWNGPYGGGQVQWGRGY